MYKLNLLDKPLSFYGSRTDIDPLRFGEISEDLSSVIGKNNWNFIYEGSNNYRSTYLDKGLAIYGTQWARLIESRQQACQRLGTKFIQLIVPNKATLMPEYFPESLGEGITPILQRLLQSEPQAHLLCPLEQLRDVNLREFIYRRNDSHLTVAGNVMLAEMLLQALEITPQNKSFINVEPVEHIGDLGSKFNSPIKEIYYAPSFKNGFLDQSQNIKTYEKIVVGFNGIHQLFFNNLSPIDMKLLVIGNSFFERVPSWGMSPIFSSLFKHYSFFWSPDFNPEIIKSYKPDIVIMQTCERFLTKLPSF